MRVYLDTNVVSFALRGWRKGVKGRRCRDSRRLLRKIREGRLAGVVSPLTLAEVKATPQEWLRKRMIRALARSGVELLPAEISREVARLARVYRAADVVQRSAVADSQHLAWTTLCGADILTSWNRRNVVRLKTRQRLAIINLALKYRPVVVETPTEVLRETHVE